MVTGTWSKIDAPALLRSSHTVSVVGSKVYIFGGEIKAREPVPNTVHVIDLADGTYKEFSGTGDIPDARVGHTAAVLNGEIYVFGGRGGAAMVPLEEAGSVYAFSPSTTSWRKITPPSGPTPQARSYHCSTATADAILIHAGCGNADVGRLNDLWSFNVKEQVWTQLQDAPGDPRGGSAIAFQSQTDKLWRFGGFNGKTEVGGVIDHVDLGSAVDRAQWQTIAFAPGPNDKAACPGARSVTGLHTLTNGTLITLFGEGKPSPTGGHDAAGNFYGDVWIFDPTTSEWTEVEQKGDGPGERGWFSSDVRDEGIVVWGGLNGQNERIPDGWILKLE